MTERKNRDDDVTLVFLPINQVYCFISDKTGELHREGGGPLFFARKSDAEAIANLNGRTVARRTGKLIPTRL